MRISDWSSDGCSSDLCGARWIGSSPLSVTWKLPSQRTDWPASCLQWDCRPIRTLESLQTDGPMHNNDRNMVCLKNIISNCRARIVRSEEHTSELQSLMRISYAVFCLKKKKNTTTQFTSKSIHTI